MFKKAKYYNDCGELKAATFFKILKTGDKTLLCYSGKPKHKELDSIWESIETEYEQKTATPQYIYKIAESNNDCLDIIRNNGLILLYWKKKLAPDRDWSNDEKYWDVEGYDANGIYAIILQERTRFNIRKIQEQEIKELKDKSQKPITIERLKHYVELGLEKDYIDFEKISVLEWLDLCALYSERAEAIKNSQR